MLKKLSLHWYTTVMNLYKSAVLIKYEGKTYKWNAFPIKYT